LQTGGLASGQFHQIDFGFLGIFRAWAIGTMPTCSPAASDQRIRAH